MASGSSTNYADWRSRRAAASRRSQSPHTGTGTPARTPRTRASTRSSRSRSIRSTCAGPSPRWLGADTVHGERSPRERRCLLQLPHRVPGPVAALDLPATRGARQRLVARAPGSASSDRRARFPLLELISTTRLRCQQRRHLIGSVAAVDHRPFSRDRRPLWRRGRLHFRARAKAMRRKSASHDSAAVRYAACRRVDGRHAGGTRTEISYRLPSIFPLGIRRPFTHDRNCQCAGARRRRIRPRPHAT